MDCWAVCYLSFDIAFYMIDYTKWNRPLRVFNTPWHIANQYELYKLPNTHWTHIVNSVRKWGIYRPTPENLSQVPFYEKGKYDIAVLHVDQQCIDDSIGKSQLYQQLNEVVGDIPKIVINHGTPYWPELFEESLIKAKMQMLIGNNYMVSNSERAGEMWGKMGRDSKVIIHGMDVDEWFDLPKEPRVITTLSPHGLDRYYNRRLLISVKDMLKERGITHTWVTVDWVAKDFDDYRDFIGRSLLYFNPTLESPMPRSRTEAMLSGSCVITLANHGAEKFIKQGENGFLVPDNPNQVCDLIYGLMDGLYTKSVEIGQRGKETARALFNKDRFQSEWVSLINQVLEENNIHE
jgi:hypothetical protein